MAMNDVYVWCLHQQSTCSLKNRGRGQIVITQYCWVFIAVDYVRGNEGCVCKMPIIDCVICERTLMAEYTSKGNLHTRTVSKMYHYQN